jgi:hypothetical protein
MLRIVKYVLAIVIALPLISIYFSSMFLPMRFYSQSFIVQRSFLSYAFYGGLMLLLASLFIKDFSKSLSEVLVIVAIAVLGLYSYGAGLFYDLNEFSHSKHYVIPPSFIYMPCPDSYRCDAFSVLAISVPLSIAMAMLIYGSLGILETSRARKTE